MRNLSVFGSGRATVLLRILCPGGVYAKHAIVALEKLLADVCRALLDALMLRLRTVYFTQVRA
jgi:hypothetical protein